MAETRRSNGHAVQAVAIASPRLPWGQRMAYSVGHVLNDLCASMWFTYLLVFFHYVVKFSNEMAGYLMLLGQVADAICTPLVGYEMDKTNGCCGYTKRKSWHLIGTICVMLSFPFFFMTCLYCDENTHMWSKFIYYAPFLVLSQFGWASTQISHLALIPELTDNQNERVLLNAFRYAFTVLSNLTVYALTWFVLSTGSSTKDKASITPEDAPQFRLLILSVVGGGLLFSIMFHVGTHENREHCAEKDVIMSCGNVQAKMTWSDWLKEGQFYQVAFLYMFTRLAVNVSQVYLPMYITDSLFLDKQYIAIVPLVVYFTGFATSFAMRPLSQLLGRKLMYCFGSLFIIGSSVAVYFLNKHHNIYVFAPAIFLGCGGSILLISSLSIVAELIGTHTSSGAFVYGAMSFTDKLSNGLAVLLIQTFHPCKTTSCCAACEWYYKDVMMFVPGGIGLLALVALVTLAPRTIGSLKFDKGVYLFAEEQEPLLEDSTHLPNEDEELEGVSDVIVIYDDEDTCCSCCCPTPQQQQRKQDKYIDEDTDNESVDSDDLPNGTLPCGLMSNGLTHYGQRTTCGAIPAEYNGQPPVQRQESRTSLRSNHSGLLSTSPLPSPTDYGMVKGCGAIPNEYRDRDRRSPLLRQNSLGTPQLRRRQAPSPLTLGVQRQHSHPPTDHHDHPAEDHNPNVHVQVNSDGNQQRNSSADEPQSEAEVPQIEIDVAISGDPNRQES